MKTTYVYKRDESGKLFAQEVNKTSTVKYTLGDVERDGRQVFDHFGMNGRQMLADSVNLTKGMDSSSYRQFHDKLYAKQRG